MVKQIIWKRVVLGGLLAGLISNISGISLAHFVFGSELKAMMEAAGLAAFPAYTGPLHLTTRFATGIALVWLYAAIRPRFGPGPKTALIAAVTSWFFLYVVFVAGILPWGVLPSPLLGVTLVWGLVELALMALAGGWVYKEG